jgi:hypothetical protein
MGTQVEVIRDFGEFKAGDVIDTLTDEQIASHVKSGDLKIADPSEGIDAA